MNFSIDQIQLFLVVSIVFFFGACMGSFLNVVIWRLPRDKKLTGRSKCPDCHHVLNALDLIPIFGYLIRGGQCAYCKKPISSRYLIMEIIVGLLFVLALYIISPTFQLGSLYDNFMLLKLWFIFSILLIVFVIDLEHYLILNKVIYPAIVVVLAFSFLMSTGVSFNPLSAFVPVLLNSAIGGLAGFLPFYLLWRLSGGKWMGLGDAKFGLFLGVVLGFPQIWVCYFIAFMLGGLVSVPLLLTKKKELSSKLPFGTFLAVAALLTIWFGVPLATWYFGLIGWV